MRFKIERTSLWDDDVAPCPEATKGEVDRWDIRTFKSPEEHDAKLADRMGAWHDRGTDHTVITGPRGGAQGIKRKVESEAAWYVEIATLEDPWAFSEQHGELILKTARADGVTPTIEIYDNYRE